MSKKIKVSLTSSKSKKALSLDDKFISLGNGECIFLLTIKKKNIMNVIQERKEIGVLPKYIHKGK